MSSSELDNTPTSRRFQLNLTTMVIFHPKKAFKKIGEQPRSSWVTPMLILSLTVIIGVIVAGWIKQQAAMMGEPTLPPDFEYYSPEDQAQFLQASQATQGAAFVYVLPIIGSLMGIWLGWLVVGGILHLSTTLFGGRGDTSISMNIVAWSNLPFAIREIVRLVYMLIEKKLIGNPGLSGFSSAGDGSWAIITSAILGLIDIYLIWHVILLVIGVRATTGLTIGKAIGSVLITIGLVVGLQAAAQFLLVKLGSLSITSPFFF